MKAATLGEGCTVDVGGAVVTGTENNPLVQLALQKMLKLKVLRHQSCPLFEGSEVVTKESDVRAEAVMNSVMTQLER